MAITGFFKKTGTTGVLWVLMFFAGTAHAQFTPFEVVGQIGGSSYAVAISGNYAYVGEGANLVVLNVSNPASPTYVGRVLLDNLVRDVAISGNVAYVALQENGICAVDISSPGSPHVLGEYVSPGQAWNLDVSGDYLYVAYDNITVGLNASGLLILDISQPAPTLVKNLNTFDVRDVDVSGNYAFCVGGPYLRVVDVSAPASASPVTTVTLPSWGNARAIRVSDDFLYVCVDNASPVVGLQIYGISPDPSNPVELGHCDAADQPYDVAIVGTTALVAGLNSGLQLIDISNPSNPTLAGQLDLTDQSVKVAGSGTEAFVADGYGGFATVNISNPALPVRDSVRAIATQPNGSRVIGNTAYVADGTQGLQFFDLSVPQNPVYQGTHPVDHYGAPEDVDVATGRAYVGGSYGLFEAVDVSNILTPVRLGKFSAPSWVSQVRVWGDYGFLACQSAGTVVVNLADPTSISIAASLAGPQSARGSSSSVYSIASAGSTLYAGYGGNVSGMQILSFTSATQQLSEITHYPTGGTVYDIRLGGDRAYLSCWSSGLELVKLAPADTPEYWSSYNGPGYVFQTCVSGSCAVAANAEDVRILDVSNPASMVYKQTIDLPGAIQHVTAFNGACLVSSREGGLYIIRPPAVAARWTVY